MSTLKDTLTEDMKNAMRAKDAERLGTIRMLLAAIKQREVDERISLDDAQTLAVVEKLVKQRKDSITAFEAAARQDLADKEKAEMAVLVAYLPARLSDAEVKAEIALIVTALTNELGRKPVQADMGKIMAAAKAKLAGKADMGSVSVAIKAALA